MLLCDYLMVYASCSDKLYSLFDSGGDGGCDHCSDVCHDLAESAVSLSQSLLGGVDAVLHDPPSPQRQRWGHWLSNKFRLIHEHY